MASHLFLTFPIIMTYPKNQLGPSNGGVSLTLFFAGFSGSLWGFQNSQTLRWQDFYRTFQASMVAERVWDCSIARKSNHLFLIAWSTNPHFWLLQGLSAFKRNQPSFRVQGLSSSKKNQPFFEKIVATTSRVLWTARAIDWLQGHLLF